MNTAATLLQFLGLLSSNQNITTIDATTQNNGTHQIQTAQTWYNNNNNGGKYSMEPTITTNNNNNNNGNKLQTESKLGLPNINTIGGGGHSRRQNLPVTWKPTGELSVTQSTQTTSGPPSTVTAAARTSSPSSTNSSTVVWNPPQVVLKDTTTAIKPPDRLRQPDRLPKIMMTVPPPAASKQQQQQQRNQQQSNGIRRQTKYQNFIIDPNVAGNNNPYADPANRGAIRDISRPQNTPDIYAQPDRPRLPPNTVFVNDAAPGSSSSSSSSGGFQQPQQPRPVYQPPTQLPNQYVQGFPQQQQQIIQQPRQPLIMPPQTASVFSAGRSAAAAGGGQNTIMTGVVGGPNRNGITYVRIPSRPGIYTINPSDGTYQIQQQQGQQQGPYNTNNRVSNTGLPYNTYPGYFYNNQGQQQSIYGNQGRQSSGFPYYYGINNPLMPYATAANVFGYNRYSVVTGVNRNGRPLPPPPATQYSRLNKNNNMNGVGNQNTFDGSYGRNNNGNFLPGIRGGNGANQPPYTQSSFNNMTNNTPSPYIITNVNRNFGNSFGMNSNQFGNVNNNNNNSNGNQFGGNRNGGDQYGGNQNGGNQFGTGSTVNNNNRRGGAAPPPLIPRSVLYKDPDYENARLSPDGRFLAYLSTAYGVQNVHVMELGDFIRTTNRLPPARTVTKETERSIAGFSWLYDNRTIVYAKDSGGTEDYQLVGVDISAGTIRNLTQGDKVKANIEMISPKRPNEILIGLNDRNPVYFDLYLLDVRTGQRRLIYENNRFAALWTDWDYNLRLGQEKTDKGDNYYSTSTGNNINFNNFAGSNFVTQPELDTLYRQVRPEDAQETNPDSFDLSGRYLYWTDRTNRDKSAFIRTDFEAKTASVLVQPTQSDVSTAFYDPRTFEPWAVMIVYDRIQYYPIGMDVVGDLNYLKGLGNQFVVESVTSDGTLWLVMFFDDFTPGKYYLYDRRSRQPRSLFSVDSGVERYQLARTRPIQFLFYICKGKPSSRLPAVLLVHGGPAARDYWAYSALVQQLANRGYAVMQPNYRGSSGFGKRFEAAGDLEWGKKMQTDLLDFVSYMVRNQIADPYKVAIVGGSYGGYATLAGLAFTPELFACGVDIVGPSNLQTLVESIPEYWKPITAALKKKLGNWDTPQGQGANDPRVKQAESDQIVNAMKRNGLPVTYLLFPDEGHGFSNDENNMAFFAVAEVFLRKCLGGRAEEIGDISDSSMQIMERGDLRELQRFQTGGRSVG